ncbi:hypothetical protein JR316_0005226 [Psilocybe cubensis]|uniref:Uncharacterized protein n=2 Tax=Psilocybe cubensis TaxID=181762 RepID=A0A8H7XZJ0_PSICU|nr:hypothetical protein JR316_0005226 [Psilocybe cubensis]KAH9483125.1 hypothetical protein JR316_0005226 [Psilocybe cubensis]
MSFSVDDLVSSLSSAHVGQEAMDIAMLQAQLAETLFSAGPSNSFASSSYSSSQNMPTRGRSLGSRTCNTPRARTPSANWGMDTGRGRTNSVSSTYANEMDEDERLVEELLMPSSQFDNNYASSSSSATSLSSPIPCQSPMNSVSFSSYNPYPDPMPSSPTTSLFTTTDPFYIAQLQSLNNSSSQQSQSVFAQNGRLSQNSPFALASQYHQHGMAHNSVPFKPFAAAF